MNMLNMQVNHYFRKGDRQRAQHIRTEMRNSKRQYYQHRRDAERTDNQEN